jgi:diguanylate cyclase (GGDEF)-like protein
MFDLINRFETYIAPSDYRSEHFTSIRSNLLEQILSKSVAVVTLAILLFGVESWQRKHFIQIGIYILIYAAYVWVAWSKQMAYHWRATLLIIILFIYAIEEFYWSGVSGDGRIVMLTLTGLSVLFLGLRPGLFCLALSFISQVILGFGIPLRWIPLPDRMDVSYSANLIDWQTGNIIFLACAGALLFCSVIINEKLEGSLQKQRKLTEELEKERNNLQARVEERTADMQREIAERIQTEEELRKSEQQLRFLSIHDALTGLYNRAYFEDELIKFTQAEFYPISVIMADVDYLKLINDQNGHAAGDRILQAAAEVLKASLRKQDMIARIGGDEFVILLPNTDEREVSEILQRVKASILEHPLKERYAAPLSISLGSATVNQNSILQEALHTADSIMYSHKKRRRPGKA